MAMQDIFAPSAFGLVEMTNAINRQPYVPGFLSGRGLFTERGVTTNTVAIEDKEGVLTLVQSRPRGGPREGRNRDRRKLRPFMIPHLPLYDYIQAAELQGVRAFGTEDQAQGFEELRNDRLSSMARDLDFTLEAHRLGAIRGEILDADNTVLINLFDEFEVSANAEVDFELDAANPVEGSLLKKVAGVKRTMINKLGGAPAGAIECLCGDAFFDDLINHPDAREFYRRAQANRLQDAPVYSSFVFADVTWINYRGAGAVAVDTNKCHFYFRGVPGLFVTYFGPAGYFETVNTLGKPRYAKAKFDGWDKELEMEAESNPLNLCTRPETLVSGRRT